jgi:hypothetical protein
VWQIVTVTASIGLQIAHDLQADRVPKGLVPDMTF